MLLIIALEHQEQTGTVLDKPEHMVALCWVSPRGPMSQEKQIPKIKQMREWEERLSVRKLISAGWE